MYTLRTITETSEVNNWLGMHYEIIRREEHYDRFCEIFESRFGKTHKADDDSLSDEETVRCYAFVITENEEQLPIFKNQRNYIVTQNGKTFSNLTYK